jgi:hypothetical protein
MFDPSKLNLDLESKQDINKKEVEIIEEKKEKYEESETTINENIDSNIAEDLKN